MAAVVFTETARSGKTRRLEARFQPLGDSLPRRRQYTSAEMLQPRPGPEATFPVGTDTNTPGFPRERRGAQGGLVRND